MVDFFEFFRFFDFSTRGGSKWSILLNFFDFSTFRHRGEIVQMVDFIKFFLWPIIKMLKSRKVEKIQYVYSVKSIILISIIMNFVSFFNKTNTRTMHSHNRFLYPCFEIIRGETKKSMIFTTHFAVFCMISDYNWKNMYFFREYFGKITDKTKNRRFL